MILTYDSFEVGELSNKKVEEPYKGITVLPGMERMPPLSTFYLCAQNFCEYVVSDMTMKGELAIASDFIPAMSDWCDLFGGQRF